MKRPDWQLAGKEPDYRFTLANERTFLAWIRTALAVLASGVLLEQFAPRIQPKLALAAVALALLAAMLAGCAYFRWRDNEIAMRHAGPLPATVGIPLLGVAIGCIAIFLTALLLYRL